MSFFKNSAPSVISTPTRRYHEALSACVKCFTQAHGMHSPPAQGQGGPASPPKRLRCSIFHPYANPTRSCRAPPLAVLGPGSGRRGFFVVAGALKRGEAAT
jgi:hypothetical protein